MFRTGGAFVLLLRSSHSWVVFLFAMICVVPVIQLRLVTWVVQWDKCEKKSVCPEVSVIGSEVLRGHPGGDNQVSWQYFHG